jgi:hypothetical protein
VDCGPVWLSPVACVQSFPQLPQLPLSLVRSGQLPSPQGAVPLPSHAQAELTQKLGLQTFPQPLQLFGSEVRSSQLPSPLQSCWLSPQLEGCWQDEKFAPSGHGV